MPLYDQIFPVATGREEHRARHAVHATHGLYPGVVTLCEIGGYSQLLIGKRKKAGETFALLKMLALGNQDVEAGRVKPLAEVVARLRAERTTHWWARAFVPDAQRLSAGRLALPAITGFAPR